MKKIHISSLNEIGDKALKQHLAEHEKLSFRHKIIFKASGYKQERISKDPLTILLTINNKYASNPNFVDMIKGEIITALKINGATQDQDYLIEVL